MLDRPLAAGQRHACASATSAALRGDLRGLYLARSGKRRYAATQLEAADARRFFPCFDEPDIKARFRLRVTTPRRRTARSRTARSCRTRAARARTMTVPLRRDAAALDLPGARSRSASSSRRRRARAGSTPIRVWCVPGKKKLAGFALECARRVAAPARGVLRPALPVREARPGRGARLRVRRDGERGRGDLPRDAAAGRSRRPSRWPRRSASPR